MSKDGDKQGRRKGGGKGGRSGAPKRPRGGQSRYTVAAGERILELLRGGMSLRKAAEGEGVTCQTVQRWCAAHPAFAEQYARAREAGYAALGERLLELPGVAHDAALDEVTGRLRIEACRFEADVLKWTLARMLPKVYGDRKAVEVSGPDGKDLLPQHSREEMAEFAAMLASAQAEVARCTDGLESNYDGDGGSGGDE